MEVNGTGAPGSAPHGVKRRAEEEPRNDQRLAKRFDLLNLEPNGKLYIPVSQASSGKDGKDDDAMHLDDSKDKIYIYNLDEELASVDAEEGMIFLPDIEKKIGKIPKHILTGDLRPTAENQMILYDVPTSLTLPQDRDNVRKAIIESRARARAKQIAVPHQAASSHVTETNGTAKEGINGHHRTSYMADQQAHDAMDIG